MTSESKHDGLRHATDKAVDTMGGMVGKAEAGMVTGAGGFVSNAGISDLYEIHAGKLAVQRAQSQAVRDIGQKMIEDHTESSLKLEKAAARSEKVKTSDIPGELDSRRSRMIEHLRDAPAEDFDNTYVDQQTLAHEEALKLMRHYGKEGDCPALRSFADEAAPMIESHLARIKQIEPAG